MSSDKQQTIEGFGQSDPTDGRKRLDWTSKYPDDARREIRREAFYLACLLFGAPVAMFVLWLRLPQPWVGASEQDYAVILKFALSWVSGTLGGVLYDLKWLYHSVARQRWHIDRRLWRIFTPHISGGLAFGMTALFESNIVRVFDQSITARSVTVVGVSFLVGYFSDSAVAKMTEVADTLFGTTRSREKHKEDYEVPQSPSTRL
jgi:hypothetical protein